MSESIIITERNLLDAIADLIEVPGNTDSWWVIVRARTLAGLPAGDYGPMPSEIEDTPTARMIINQLYDDPPDAFAFRADPNMAPANDDARSIEVLTSLTTDNFPAE